VRDAPSLISAWNEAFRKRYPQIDAQFVRMATRDLLQRTMSNTRLGKTTVDVLHPPPVELAILQRMNITGKYKSPEEETAGQATTSRAAVLRDPAITAGIGQFAVIQSVVPSVGADVSLINLGEAPLLSNSSTFPGRQ
jgi:ABC-type Fe3+ transport system substrate-binding protein